MIDRIDKTTILICLLIYSGSAILWISGCSQWNPFMPEKAPVNLMIQDTVQTPELLIKTFQQAYADRDLDTYLSCLSEQFIFIMQDDDQAYYQLKNNWWDKSKEEELNRNLFTHATDIQLKLIYASSQQVSDSLCRYKYQYQLTVYDDNETRYDADGFAAFEMVKKGPAWKIEKWQDLAY
ncbi:MAG: hypothetical protein KBA26_03935 [Candidatus Delongbacteria bacterium]|nr:hypothetical protein [Candidatus Delongbacteria bacterium]